MTSQTNRRPRVALVTNETWPNLYEDDLLLVGALDAVGIDSRPAVWSDAGIDWLGFDALVMRTPWDYFIRLAEFRPATAGPIPAENTRL